ncbi:Spo0E family sporulation regulatory protein-aspartic acid phosphatase [Chengkuizengella axinellae]|uniref:Spo0E family sporulation regulatory protein-aspartic acid phosphatase n=1 Tax=Chengkuizengella axinellae TaxID=3064388 RepID=A0ABT9J507_9BACL|nr:Spo0E family sporulation regulatory protein-aspartic acid phosphatase [Chengkuizengella sp. 2205SS18-9]MDP5276702.1 Spo0E family sporulation regulatory protein-aspartic acid phosphatase [Chengkuizengella sp. 2205SS18-9]
MDKAIKLYQYEVFEKDLQEDEIKSIIKKELMKLENLRIELNKLQDHFNEHYTECLILSQKIDEILNRIHILQKRLVKPNAHKKQSNSDD